MPHITHTPRVLTIAGSDSGGGAGIQADLKAFARCGVHGTSAITAITAQNTLGVSAVHSIPSDIILAQVRAVIADIGVDAVKVGMLGTVEAVRAVAQALDELPAGTPVVVDPVMVAESGARLLDPGAEEALVAEILPRATLLTPNLPEARALARHASPATRKAAGTGALTAPGHDGALDIEGAGGSAPGEEQGGGPSEEEGGGAGEEGGGAGEEGGGAGEEGGGPSKKQGGGPPSKEQGSGDDEHAAALALARAVLSLGPDMVVLTGGHRAQAVDLFLDSAAPERIVSIPGERHSGGAAHGSGCTHSSVLAAQLALGRAPLQAAFAARALAGVAVADGLRDVGEGPGPVDVIGLARLRSSPRR